MRNNIELIINEINLNSEIDNFQNILELVSNNVFIMSRVESFSENRIRNCPGTDASLKSLSGIISLCSIVDFRDVYVLLRQIRDNLFLDLFLFEAQKQLSDTSDSDDYFKNFDLNDYDSIFKSLSLHINHCIEKEKNEEEYIEIKKWRNNKLLACDSKEKKKCFGFSKYRSYIKNHNKDFCDCDKLFLKDSFNNLNNLLNDFVHGNSESILRSNDKPKVYFQHIKEILNKIKHLYLITLFFVDSTLLVSEDYICYMEQNEEPPIGSQYWTCGFVKEAFKEIKNSNKQLFDFLVTHNIYSIEIE